MDHMTTPGTDLSPSRIGLGTWAIGGWMWGGIATLTYGALWRGLLSGRVRSDTRFGGDDLRRTDPKFRPPSPEQLDPLDEAMGWSLEVPAAGRATA